MSLKVGIVGLPNVGKSTLFNAITKQKISVQNYPFTTIEPNVGVVVVPDKRLDFLSDLYEPKKTTPTTYEFIDIAGLIKGASKGEGLGNKFLSHIKEVDAICQVVRCFEDDNIIHVDGKLNPINDIETINLELIFSDLEIVENRISRIEKKAQTSKDKELEEELKLLLKIKNSLMNNKSIRNLDLSIEELNIIKSFNLLSLKPIIYLANIKEEDINKENKYVNELEQYLKKEEIIKISAKIENEINELSEEEKKEYLSSLNISESGLDKLINKSYSLLGLATFFTVGKDEVRAWTFKLGTKAPQCAGIIHSDIEKGFIRAEVMKYEDLKKYGSELKVKEAGKLNIEGKEYEIKDGDICYFRFNV